MENSRKVVKVILNSSEINYLVVSLQDGRIIESGESESENNTFEDTYMKVSSIEVGKHPKISYNYGVYTRRSVGKTPVFTELNYVVLAVEELKIKLEENVGQTD